MKNLIKEYESGKYDVNDYSSYKKISKCKPTWK